MIKQEAMKPGEGAPIMAFRLLNHSSAFLRVSWYPAQTLISVVKLSPFNASSQSERRAIAHSPIQIQATLTRQFRPSQRCSRFQKHVNVIAVSTGHSSVGKSMNQ